MDMRHLLGTAARFEGIGRGYSGAVLDLPDLSDPVPAGPIGKAWWRNTAAAARRIASANAVNAPDTPVAQKTRQALRFEARAAAKNAAASEQVAARKLAMGSLNLNRKRRADLARIPLKVPV